MPTPRKGRAPAPRRQARDAADAPAVIVRYAARPDGAGSALDAALAPLRRWRVQRVPNSAPIAGRGVVDGVLWEIGPDRPPDARLVARLAERGPVVSFSLDPDAPREVAALSHSLGFSAHLTLPLSSQGVAAALGMPPQPDLGTRLAGVTSRIAAEVTARRFAGVIGEVTSRRDPGGVAAVLLSRARAWLPLPEWAILATDQTGEPRWLAASGGTETSRATVETLAAQVATSGTALLSPRLAGEAMFDVRVEAAAIAVPLKCDGSVTAVLVGIDKGRSRRMPRPGALLTSTGVRRMLEPIACALDSALRLERAEALSVTDDLTQLYNSRFMHAVLRRETKRSSRSGQELSLLFIDLDGFKAVNDMHGHLSGSRALVEVGAVIRACARETDVVARFGGDEFAVVLPETGGVGARAVALRIRDRIAERSFLTSVGLSVRLTASIGIATHGDASASSDELLAAADAAMYWVKDHGKNGIHQVNFLSPKVQR